MRRLVDFAEVVEGNRVDEKRQHPIGGQLRVFKFQLPYDVLDQILDGLVEQDLSPRELVDRGFAADTVRRVSNLLDLAEYKRRQAPPGVKITRKAFGRDRRYPITNAFRRIGLAALPD